MKKKGFIAAGLAALFVASLTVPQVSAFAMSALSVFRVEGAKTITVTIDDIAQVAAYMKEHEDEFEAKFETDGSNKEIDGHELNDAELEKKFIEEHTRTLSTPAEFTDFSVNIPAFEWENAPSFTVIELKDQNFSLDDGEEASVSFSPIFVAVGEGWVYGATQGFDENLSDETKREIKDHILELPFLTENLRSQIEAIPIDTDDIYLPVIEGISRSVNIGDDKGYIYSSADLSMIMDVLPEDIAWDLPTEEEAIDADITSIVWVSDGVLNILLSGKMSEAELVKLAGSTVRTLGEL